MFHVNLRRVDCKERRVREGLVQLLGRYDRGFPDEHLGAVKAILLAARVKRVEQEVQEGGGLTVPGRHHYQVDLVGLLVIDVQNGLVDGVPVDLPFTGDDRDVLTPLDVHFP